MDTARSNFVKRWIKRQVSLVGRVLKPRACVRPQAVPEDIGWLNSTTETATLYVDLYSFWHTTVALGLASHLSCCQALGWRSRSFEPKLLQVRAEQKRKETSQGSLVQRASLRESISEVVVPTQSFVVQLLDSNLSLVCIVQSFWCGVEYASA